MEEYLDIYFDERYGKVYEKNEKGISYKFVYECEYGKIENLFIKRKINSSLKIKYYDITTPYGYGGPVILKSNDKEKLLERYRVEFEKYCMNNNIVSEFVRFHPIVKNALDFKEIYNLEKDRITLGTNIKYYEDPVESEFSKSCRKNIRKALNSGVSFEIVEKPSEVDEFIEVYYSTMDRNNASDYYYFDKEYFTGIMDNFSQNIIIVKAIFEGKVIAAGFYFTYNKMVHIHLSGTLSDYLYLSPAYVLRYAVTLWAKENGFEMIHHGGGRTNTEEDGLFKFKKSFAKNTEFDFYIGKKVWNEKVYEELCKEIQDEGNEMFFPAYRIKK